MTRTFIAAKTFDKKWASLGLDDEALRHLQIFLIDNPGAGDIIQGTGGLIKLRWNLQNTGKSGGMRVLYVDFIRSETIALVNCYKKGEKDTLTANEKAIYKTIVKAIGKELS